MTVRHSLLVLLEGQPMYGAQLKAEFESRTADVWPLNVGQVYTTLARLERDGLVAGSGPPDSEGRIRYELTPAGEAEAARWWQSPVGREAAPRSELAIKLALAVTVPGLDVSAVVQGQRTATMAQLQDLTRLKRGGVRPTADEFAWALVLENLIYTAEAEIRWLDHVEALLVRRVRRPAQPGLSQADVPGFDLSASDVPEPDVPGSNRSRADQPAPDLEESR